jgi:hypothetical protein
MKLPRFRLRTLMVAVAIFAIVFGSIVLRQRAERFRQLAESNGMRRFVTGDSEVWIWVERPVDVSPLWFEWRRALAEKYERAARYPWLPVPPDPPEPE